MTTDTDGVVVYKEEEIAECLRELAARGVDIDAIPGEKTIGYLFELLESIRPN